MSKDTPTRLEMAPQPTAGNSSIDILLRNVDPVPDAETEEFVAAIYADRLEPKSVHLNEPNRR